MWALLLSRRRAFAASVLPLLLLLRGPSLSSAVTLRELAVTSKPYSAVPLKALLDLKTSLGSGTWSSTWIAANPCNTWLHTTCDPNGNLLTLTLSGLNLAGTVPDSFYDITTLQKLDLSRNSLYGGINRYLAVINPSLWYLDLSNNLFSGPFPDIWSSPSVSYTSDTFQVTNTIDGAVFNVFIDISNTFFNGYPTVWLPGQGQYPYFCIGGNTGGAYGKTCVKTTGAVTNGDVLGGCALPDVPLRSPSECIFFCGAGNNNDSSVIVPSLVTCNSQPGMYCAPGSPGIKPACKQLPPSQKVAQLPTAVTSGNVNPSDASTLTQLYAALGSPSSLKVFSGTSIACSQLGTLAKCSSAGSITSLTLSNLGLKASISSFTAIKNLQGLQQLVLSGNSLNGDWSAYFDLKFDLPALIYLDLSNNQLFGKLPSGFNGFPTYVNVASNYFSGEATVMYQVAPANPASNGAYNDGIPAVYCPVAPAGFLDLSGNCLTTTVNAACRVQQEQKSPAQCAAVCGITIRTSPSGVPPVGPCNDGLEGTCKLTGSTFACSSTDPPIPANNKPIPSVALISFANKYIAWGTPSAVFATWNPELKCSTPGTPTNGWKGITCDDKGNVISVNLRGVGLKGPFLQPTIFENPFWSGLGRSGTVKYIDVSNNKLYGILDPVKLKFMMKLDYLDLSNNYLTGVLPEFVASQFQYLNMSNNFFVGKPYLVGIDNATAVCPGTTPAVDLSNNCFDLPATGSGCAASKPRAATQCKTFCSGASSKKATCKVKNTVCQAPTKKGGKKATGVCLKA